MCGINVVGGGEGELSTNKTERGKLMIVGELPSLCREMGRGGSSETIQQSCSCTSQSSPAPTSTLHHHLESHVQLQCVDALFLAALQHVLHYEW